MLFDQPLPRDVRDHVESIVGDRPRVLDWGRAGELYLVATQGCLVWGSDAEWQALGWHEISNGGWDAEASTLRWRTVSGGGDEVHLTEKGRLPDVFRERVGASLVVEDRQRGPGGVEVVFTARRDLGHFDRPLVWDAFAIDGRTLERPGLAEFARRRLDQLKADVEG